MLFRSGDLGDCTDPDLPPRLAALGYTHVIVRGSPARPLARVVGGLDGLTAQRSTADSQLFAVSAPRQTVVTAAINGFYDREGAGADTWRWMGSTGWWRVLNTSPEPVSAKLEINLEAFAAPRHLRVELDHQPLDSILVTAAGSTRTLGPFLLTTGEHLIGFRAVEPPESADDRVHNGDTRRLSIRFGSAQWHLAQQ